MGFFQSALSSPLGGFGFNLFQGARDRRDFRRFRREQIDPFNRDLQDVANFGQGVADEGIAFGNAFFDPTRQGKAFDRAFAPINAGLSALPGQVADDNLGVQGAFSGLQGQLASGTADIRGGFGNLAGLADQQLGTARGLVSRLGAQEGRDIRSRSAAQAGAARANLTSRGIGGSTVRQSQDALFGRELDDSLGRLQDRTVRQQLGVEETFGGQQLRAREAGLLSQERLLGESTRLGITSADSLQRGNEFGTQTQFDSLFARGDIAGAGLDFRNNAAINRLGNQRDFAQFGVDTRFRALDQRILTPFERRQQAQLQPPVR